MAEYTAVVNIFSKAISLGVDLLVVYLDSQLVVSQLNKTYCVRHPFLHQLFLRVRLLQCSFHYVTFIHIPHSENSFVDSLANQEIYWRINHLVH